MKGGIIMEYTVYCKESITRDEIKYKSYFRRPAEPLKDLVKWFDEMVKTIASREEIDVSDIVIRWSLKGINFCYYMGVLWY